MMRTVYLGHNLSKEKEKKGEQHREQEELQPLATWPKVQPVHKEEIEQHDNTHVDQIVQYQNGSQKTVTTFA